MSKFKVGDRVRVKSRSYEGVVLESTSELIGIHPGTSGIRWCCPSQAELVNDPDPTPAVFKVGDCVKSLVSDKKYIIREITPGGTIYFEGKECYYSLANFVLANPPTPQELADKYRTLRKEATAIAKELKSQGWSIQVQNDGDFRFIKSEVVTI